MLQMDIKRRQRVLIKDDDDDNDDDDDDNDNDASTAADDDNDDDDDDDDHHHHHLHLHLHDDRISQSTKTLTLLTPKCYYANLQGVVSRYAEVALLNNYLTGDQQLESNGNVSSETMIISYEIPRGSILAPLLIICFF